MKKFNLSLILFIIVTSVVVFADTPFKNDRSSYTYQQDTFFSQAPRRHPQKEHAKWGFSVSPLTSLRFASGSTRANIPRNYSRYELRFFDTFKHGSFFGAEEYVLRYSYFGHDYTVDYNRVMVDCSSNGGSLFDLQLNYPSFQLTPIFQKQNLYIMLGLIQVEVMDYHTNIDTGDYPDDEPTREYNGMMAYFGQTIAAGTEAHILRDQIVLSIEAEAGVKYSPTGPERLKEMQEIFGVIGLYQTDGSTALKFDFGLRLMMTAYLF